MRQPTFLWLHCSPTFCSAALPDLPVGIIKVSSFSILLGILIHKSAKHIDLNEPKSKDPVRFKRIKRRFLRFLSIDFVFAFLLSIYSDGIPN